jgi:hypothetical protein
VSKRLTPAEHRDEESFPCTNPALLRPCPSHAANPSPLTRVHASLTVLSRQQRLRQISWSLCIRRLDLRVQQQSRHLVAFCLGYLRRSLRFAQSLAVAPESRHRCVYDGTTRSTEYPESLAAAPESGHRCIYDGTTRSTEYPDPIDLMSTRRPDPTHEVFPLLTTPR